LHQTFKRVPASAFRSLVGTHDSCESPEHPEDENRGHNLNDHDLGDAETTLSGVQVLERSKRLWNQNLPCQIMIEIVQCRFRMRLGKELWNFTQ